MSCSYKQLLAVELGPLRLQRHSSKAAASKLPEEIVDDLAMKVSVG
jgi:hypothetical protein